MSDRTQSALVLAAAIVALLILFMAVDRQTDSRTVDTGITSRDVGVQIGATP